MDDAQKAKVATAVKWGVAVIALAVFTPVIYIALKGALGALALLAAGAVGYTMIELAPWFAMKVTNTNLKLMKGEARDNPIETRQAIALDMRAKIRESEKALTEFAAEVLNFTTEVKNLQQEQPEDAADFAEQLVQLKQLSELKKAAHANALANVEKFEQATQRAARKWKVAQSAIKMKRLAGKSAKDELNKIMAEEALDSVQTSMNRAFAELDVAMTTMAPQMAKFDKSTPFALNGEAVPAAAADATKGTTR